MYCSETLSKLLSKSDSSRAENIALNVWWRLREKYKFKNFYDNVFHDPLLVRACGWNQEPLHFLACIRLSTQSIPSHRHSLKPLFMKPNIFDANKKTGQF